MTKRQTRICKENELFVYKIYYIDKKKSVIERFNYIIIMFKTKIRIPFIVENSSSSNAATRREKIYM